MIIEIAFAIFSVFLFLLLFWKSLKEDYTVGIIFNTSFYILFSILASVLFSSYFFEEWWFWLANVAIFIGLATGVVRYKMRFFEVLEATVLALLPWFGLIFLGNGLTKGSLTSYIAALGVVGLIALFIFLSGHYKSFSWYKSGRIGVAGLAVLAFLFLVRSGVAVFVPNVLSFVGRNEVYISGSAFIVCLAGLYTLARLKS